MMNKVSYGLNSVALVFCVLIAWEYFSTQAENEFLQNELKIVASKTAEIKFAVEEAKKGQADKLKREKRKNSEMEEIAKAKADEEDHQEPVDDVPCHANDHEPQHTEVLED